jgi:hypothetical protein
MYAFAYRKIGDEEATSPDGISKVGEIGRAHV